MIEKLGVKNVQFEDLYSIDSGSIGQLSPVYGVIFLFKYSKLDRQVAKSGNAPITGEYDTNYQENGIFFGNQTIQNACGTQAVINILLNQEVDLGEELTNFKSFVGGFDGEMIGETISNSDLIRSVHNSFSTPNLIVDEDPNPPPEDSDDKNDGLFHFIGYIYKSGFIYELDGLKNYPIKHDECKDMEEFITKIPQVLMNRISKYGNELRFSCLVVTNDKLNQANELGDEEMKYQEINKRKIWDKEIELRQHDYTNLFVNMIKGISSKLDDEQWNALLEKARDRTKAKFK